MPRQPRVLRRADRRRLRQPRRHGGDRKGKGARVEVHEWRGFGRQKNYALSLATGAWVLSIDADERATPELAGAIKAALADPARMHGNFRAARVSAAGEMRHSGWYPDYVLRLFRRGKAGFDDALVHERVICEGSGETARPAADSSSRAQLEDALSRMDRYSTASAEALVASGRRVSFLAGIGHGLYAFLRTYVLRRVFSTAPRDFLLAVANAEGSYYRYMKAWLATRGASSFLTSAAACAFGVALILVRLPITLSRAQSPRPGRRCSCRHDHACSG